jgi:amino acid adenylation domain-containing protein
MSARSPFQEHERLDGSLEPEVGIKRQQASTYDKPDNEILLSYEQQRLWYLERLNPGSAVYHIAPAIYLKGQLEVEALQRSFQTIIQRHEVLRTTFEERAGIPYQVIHAGWQFPLPVTDLRAFPASEKQQRAEELAGQDARQPFDLSQLPLIRAQLLRLADEEWLLLLTIHHIIFDSWSFDILFQELSASYRAYINQAEPTLESLSAQYADYAQEQRGAGQQEIYARQRAYWQGQLQGVPEMLDLPRDYPRPVLSSFAGDYLPVAIDASLADDLRKLAQQEESSLNLLLLAAWFTVLYRYSGLDDLVIGTPIANRSNQAREKLLGFFVNTLALKVSTGDDPHFTDLLKRVREVVTQAGEHADLPFEQIVGLIFPAHELGHLPLVQVLFAFQDDQGKYLQLPGVEASLQHRRTLTSKFDLNLELTEGPQGLSGILEYSRELFTPERIQRMLGHLNTLLRGIVSNPQQRLNDLPLLTDAEEQQIRAWNQTETVYPQKHLLPQLIEDQVERTPTAPAVVFEGQSLTYRELNRRANQLAHYLQENGVGPDVIVGVCLYRSLELVVALLAIIKAGGAYVPLDPDHPADLLTFMIADAGMSLVLVQQQTVHRLPAEQVRVLPVDAETVAWSQAAQENLPCSVEADHLAYMIYTSGSTGKPKGTMNTHRGIRNRLLWMQDAYRLTEQDRVLQKTPYSFDVSVWEFFWPLLTGSSLIVARPDGHRDPAYLAQLIAEQRITTIHFVPSMLQMFLEAPGLENCKDLKRVICSGEALPFDLQKRFFARFKQCGLYNLYGPTEAAIDVTAWTCDAQSALEIVPIGRPIANITTYILNPALQLVPVGVPGELYLGGEGLARGYLKQSALTAARFVPHPFSLTGGERLYRTGDLASYLPDGSIDFLGRADFQVKLHGIRIETGEIEAALDSHPAIGQSVVTMHKDDHGQKWLVAYFLPVQNQRPGIEELREHLQQRIPAYMIPAVFVPLTELPLTSSGKVNRKALPAPVQTTGSDADGSYLRAGLSSAYAAPGNEVERIMVAVWEEYLHFRPIGIHDKFNELGGDSLRILQVISRLSNTFLVRLTIRDFLINPTIATLAPLVAQRLEQEFDRSKLEQLLEEFGS